MAVDGSVAVDSSVVLVSDDLDVFALDVLDLDVLDLDEVVVANDEVVLDDAIVFG